MFISRSSSQEDNMFYCCAKDFTLWQCFLLSLWSHYVFACKLCNILQTLTASCFTKSKKKFENPPPTTPKFQLPHPLKPKTLSQFFFKTKFGKAFYPKIRRIETFMQTPMPSFPSSHTQFFYCTYSNSFAHGPINDVTPSLS
jgi:hypothetical protein